MNDTPMRAHRLREHIAEIESWEEAEDLLADAQKFAMGDYVPYADPALFEFTLDLAARGLLQLPFPSTYFEFQADTNFRTLGCLCWIEADALCLRAYVEVSRDRWGRLPGTAVLDAQGIGFAPETELGGDDGEHPIKAMIATAGAIAAIASRESTVTKVDAPEALNRARAKRGRTPLPAYYVVNLQRGGSPSGRVESIGESRRSPRGHWRRGHFRTLATGVLVPIPPTLVATKDGGFVHHDYRLRLLPKAHDDVPEV